MILKEFEVPLEPVAKERPRFATRCGQVRTYTSKKTRIFENTLFSLILPHCNAEPFEGPLKLTLEFHVTPPAKKVRELPAVRPDIDNYIKSVCDALNPNKKEGFSGMWRDDGQVVELVAKKVYASPQPKIKIKIETV